MIRFSTPTRGNWRSSRHASTQRFDLHAGPTVYSTRTSEISRVYFEDLCSGISKHAAQNPSVMNIPMSRQTPFAARASEISLNDFTEPFKLGF